MTDQHKEILVSVSVNCGKDDAMAVKTVEVLSRAIIGLALEELTVTLSIIRMDEDSE